MYRFETISHIRKRSRYNDRHRIIDIGGFHLLLDINFHNPVLINRLIFVHFSLSIFLIKFVLRPFFCPLRRLSFYFNGVKLVFFFDMSKLLKLYIVQENALFRLFFKHQASKSHVPRLHTIPYKKFF